MDGDSQVRTAPSGWGLASVSTTDTRGPGYNSWEMITLRYNQPHHFGANKRSIPQGLNMQYEAPLHTLGKTNVLFWEILSVKL
jgi:hypothetical protein